MSQESPRTTDEAGDEAGAYRPASMSHGERMYESERAATLRRLVEVEGIGQYEAEDWISRWEREAERLGLEPRARAFWEDGEIWIAWRRSEESKW